jgi:glyoxylase-like metal-dependent hydrolase (beta-lactamase superfamily II)
MTAPPIKLYIQNHGFLGCDIRWFILGKNFADRHDRNPSTEWYSCPINTLIIEHPDGNILFDTSCPRDWESRWAESGNADSNPYENVSEEQYLDSSLDKMNLGVESFATVVLSHLHFDHAGNVGMFIDQGPEIIADRRERDYARGIPNFEGAYLREDYGDLSFLTTVEGDVEIATGVTLLSLPGHTAGTLGVMVDLPETGPVIYTSDAAYMAENYELGMDPISQSPLDWIASIQRLRSLVEATGATVFFSHDSKQLAHTRIAPDYYS